MSFVFIDDEAPPAGRSYRGAVASVPVATSFTHTHNGGVRTGRWVVGVLSRQGAGAGTPAAPSSVTFCGTALSKIAEQNAASQLSVSIWASTSDITADGTDDVVVSGFSASQNASATILWSTDDIGTYAAQTNGASTSDPANLNLNTQSGGLVFALAAGVGTPSVSWTGLTEDYDAVVNTNYNYSAASAEIAGGSTPLTVTADYAGSESTFAACSVSLR